MMAQRTAQARYAVGLGQVVSELDRPGRGQKADEGERPKRHDLPPQVALAALAPRPFAVELIGSWRGRQRRRSCWRRCPRARTPRRR